jgi:hypothetical protein
LQRVIASAACAFSSGRIGSVGRAITRAGPGDPDVAVALADAGRLVCGEAFGWSCIAR